MRVGLEGMLDKPAGQADAGIATPRAHNGEMTSSSRGKSEVLAEYYRKLGTPTTNKEFDAEFANEINA